MGCEELTTAASDTSGETDTSTIIIHVWISWWLVFYLLTVWTLSIKMWQMLTPSPLSVTQLEAGQIQTFYSPFLVCGCLRVQSGSNCDESFSITLHFPPSWLIHACHANSVVKSTSPLSHPPFIVFRDLSAKSSWGLFSPLDVSE